MDLFQKYRNQEYVKVSYRKLQSMKKKLRTTLLSRNAMKNTNYELAKKVQELKRTLKETEERCELLNTEKVQAISSAQLYQGKFMQLVSKIYEAIGLTAFSDGVALFPTLPVVVANNENISNAPSSGRVPDGTSFGPSGTAYRPMNNLNHILSPVSENDTAESIAHRDDLQGNNHSPNVTSTSEINQEKIVPEPVSVPERIIEPSSNERTQRSVDSLCIVDTKTLPVHTGVSLKIEVEEDLEPVSCHSDEESSHTICDGEGTSVEVTPDPPTDPLQNVSIANSKQDASIITTGSSPSNMHIAPRRRNALSPQRQSSLSNFGNETTRECSTIPGSSNNFRPIIVKTEHLSGEDTPPPTARGSTFDISGNFRITSTPSTSRFRIMDLMEFEPNFVGFSSPGRSSKKRRKSATTNSEQSSASENEEQSFQHKRVQNKTKSPKVRQSLRCSPNAKNASKKFKGTPPNRTLRFNSTSSSTNSNDSTGMPHSRRARKVNYKEPPLNRSFKSIAPVIVPPKKSSSRLIKNQNKSVIENTSWYCSICDQSKQIAMIKCLLCKRWFHVVCAKVSSRQKTFYCSGCRHAKSI